MRLGDIISVANVEKCGNRTIPVLSMTMHDGLVLQTDRFKKTIASKDLSGYKVVRRNQLVVSFPIDEGVLYIQDVADTGIVSPAYAVWDVSTKMVLPRFLGLFLRCPKSIQHYRSKLRGSTARRRTIPREDFLAMEIPGFSIAEQDRICLVIEKIESVIKACDKQIQSLGQLVKSRFVEMFGDVTVNDRGWGIATLPELGELNRGVSKVRPRNSPELLGGPYPLVQTGDVSNSGLWIKNYSSTYSDKGLAQSRLWKRGTLCITIAANIAQTAILDFDACFPDSVVGFVPNERTDAIFIHYWFSFFQKILEAQAPQVAQKNINLRILSGLKVVEPPLALQREFAAFVAKVDKLAFAARQRRDIAQKLYRAKMQEFFG